MCLKQKKEQTMKLLTMTGVALVLTTLTGCLSLNENAVSAPYCAKTKTPVFETDVDVGGQTTGTASGITVLGVFWFGPSEFADGVTYNNGQFDFGFGSAAKVKSAAAYNAIKSSQSDILIGPKYVVENKNYFFLLI